MTAAAPLSHCPLFLAVVAAAACAFANGHIYHLVDEQRGRKRCYPNFLSSLPGERKRALKHQVRWGLQWLVTKRRRCLSISIESEVAAAAAIAASKRIGNGIGHTLTPSHSSHSRARATEREKEICGRFDLRRASFPFVLPPASDALVSMAKDMAGEREKERGRVNG